MKILPLAKELTEFLKKHNLTKKFTKQAELFKNNPRHPSLHNELLAPKEFGIRSFRINRSYRALFIFDSTRESVEIIDINKHYQ